MLKNVLLCLFLVSPTHSNEETSTTSESSCAVVDRTLVDDLQGRISSLERRLRAIEQPVWQISGASENWNVCAEGPCKCRIETKSLSCCRLDLADLPPTQLVPKDVLKLQVGLAHMFQLYGAHS